MLFWVKCLDENIRYGFVARTPYEAMDKMIYCLNLKHRDNNVTINKTTSGLHLWIEHTGKTYAIANTGII